MMITRAAFIIIATIIASSPAFSDNHNSANTPLPAPAHIHMEFRAKGMIRAAVKGDAGVQGRRVSENDPVRVASISKLVGALAVMRLVDEGKIDLDLDISRYLGFWVRNPAFPDQPITMRHLLSHQSGIRDKVDYILPLDGAIKTVLDNPESWEGKYPPGSYFSYANLNSPIIAATVEAATGERFDKLVERTVLTPMKLDACFNWQAGCSAERRAQAVTLLRPNGDLAKDAPMQVEPCVFVPAKSDGSCDIARYQLGKNGSAFSPQGGLRISARDLSKIGQLLLRKGKPILSRKSFDEMTRVQWQFSGQNGDDEKGYFTAYGLGVHMLKDVKGDVWMGHVGEAYSLRAGLWVNMKSGKGQMRYVTMVDEFAPVGHCLESCP